MENRKYIDFLEDEVTRCYERELYREDIATELLWPEIVYSEIDKRFLPGFISLDLDFRWDTRKLREREKHAERYWNFLQYPLKQLKGYKPKTPERKDDIEQIGIEARKLILDRNILKDELSLLLSHESVHFSDASLKIYSEIEGKRIKVFDDLIPKKPFEIKIKVYQILAPWIEVEPWGFVPFLEYTIQISEYLIDELWDREFLIWRSLPNRLLPQRKIKKIRSGEELSYVTSHYLKRPIFLKFPRDQENYESLCKDLKGYIVKRDDESFTVELEEEGFDRIKTLPYDFESYLLKDKDQKLPLRISLRIKDVNDLVYIVKELNGVDFIRNVHKIGKNYPDVLCIDIDRPYKVSWPKIREISDAIDSFLEKYDIPYRNKYSAGQKGGIHKEIFHDFDYIPSDFVPLRGFHFEELEEERRYFEFAKDVAQYIIVGAHVESGGKLLNISLSSHKRVVKRLDKPLLDLSIMHRHGGYRTILSTSPLSGLASIPFKEIPQTLEKAKEQANPARVLKELPYIWPGKVEKSIMLDFLSDFLSKYWKAFMWYVRFSDRDDFFERKWKV